MMHPSKVLFLALPALALIACGGQDTETAPAPEPEQSVQSAPAAQRAEPADAAPPSATPDPAADPEAIARARTDREQLRSGRGEEVHWWDDDALAAELGLDPQQRAALLEVREALHASRLEGRRQLRELRGQAAGLEGDAARLAELQTSIGELRERLDQTEDRWQDTVRDTLSPTQLEQLEDLIKPRQ